MTLVDDLLDTFTLEELLSMNGLTEHETLEILFNQGYIHQPERLVHKYESTSYEGEDI